MADTQSKAADNKPSHYVGIGASAGGLEALQRLLQYLPPDAGACYVIVQHLSPNYKSMMLELLTKYTSMALQMVTDGVELKPNTIYLIPPKKSIVVSDSHLLLNEKATDSGLTLSIDIFFRSLAKEQKERSIGIILSGTGSDGSRGIQTLKEAGALIVAQEPASAKFDGMPTNAIQTGIVDLILKPEDIGGKLDAYMSHPLIVGDLSPIGKLMTGNEPVLSEIFSLLKKKYGIDFSLYKSSTVARRIERRMTINQLASLRDYLSYIYKESQEIDILSRDLLIGVTRFFRDKEVFQSMQDSIVPSIVSESPEDRDIRVWVAGCSTGEEAYSIAILFAEALFNQNIDRVVKIFATDVNGQAISTAGIGRYSSDLLQDVGPAYLSSYFTRASGSDYQVSDQIRQKVIFATHNLIADPPFSNMDLVVCRNILIYFQHSVQKKVLTSLLFSLRKGGYLLLGSSESLADLAPHFEAIDERNRIFRKRSSLKIPIGDAPANKSVGSVNSQSIPTVARLMRDYRGTGAVGSTVNFANEALITRYAPPCILLNEHQEAIHVYGDVSKFIKRLPPGKISVEIKDMVNDDMSIAVSSAIHTALQTNEEVFYTDVVTQYDGVNIGLNIRVNHTKEKSSDLSPGYIWLIFEEVESNGKVNDAVATSFNVSEQARQRISFLEQELKHNQEHLQVTVEELESTNEELQSANEELMTSNEELQSTNEELQSVNEELYTVNSEYQEKIAEISQVNNDLDEVLGLSNIGIIFLDKNMLIRRFTKAASEFVNLLDTDLNRPLHHISKNIQYENMIADVSEVFVSNIKKEHEVIMEDNRVIRITLNPYKYNDMAQTEGVAVIFSDVSKLKRTEQAMAEAFSHLKDSVYTMLDTLDNDSNMGGIQALMIGEVGATRELLIAAARNIEEYAVNVKHAEDTDAAMDYLRAGRFDVCLLYYGASEDLVVNFLRELKKSGFVTPITVVKESANLTIDTLLLSKGIIDIVSLDQLTSNSLAKTIRHSIRRFRLGELNAIHASNILGANA